MWGYRIRFRRKAGFIRTFLFFLPKPATQSRLLTPRRISIAWHFISTEYTEKKNYLYEEGFNGYLRTSIYSRIGN